MKTLRLAALAPVILALSIQVARADPLPAVDRIVCTPAVSACAALVRVPARPSATLQEWLARRQLQARPTQWEVIFITLPGTDPAATDLLQQQVLEMLLGRIGVLSDSSSATTGKTP